MWFLIFYNVRNKVYFPLWIILLLKDDFNIYSKHISMRLKTVRTFLAQIFNPWALHDILYKVFSYILTKDKNKSLSMVPSISYLHPLADI